MRTISIQNLFKDEPKLVDVLLGFVNIPDIEIRNKLVKSFCHHKQVKPILEQNGLLPDFFYYYLIGVIDSM